MDENVLEKNIESILFWKAEPLKFSELAKILNIPIEKIRESIFEIQKKYSDLGITLIINNDEATFVTSKETSPLIENLQREELTKDLSKAALETLSIILYRGPMKRSEIDYIRGVNSQFILRILLIRGLIEKKTDPKDERAYIYSVTTETLGHLGVSKINELPEYEQVNLDINAFLDRQQEQDEKTKDNENTTEN